MIKVVWTNARPTHTLAIKQLGIDPHTMLPDRAGRPMPIAHGGEPIPGLI